MFKNGLHCFFGYNEAEIKAHYIKIYQAGDEDHLYQDDDSIEDAMKMDRMSSSKWKTF